MPRAENGWKVCPRCNRNLPTSQYHRNVCTFDGLTNYCKQCVADSNKKPPLWLNIQEFIELYPKTPMPDLCARYCRTVGTIANWASWFRNNGINIPYRCSKRGGTAYDHKTYAEFANGKPLSTVADHFGISYSSAVRRNRNCRKEGYVINTPKGYYK